MGVSGIGFSLNSETYVLGVKVVIHFTTRVQYHVHLKCNYDIKSFNRIVWTCTCLLNLFTRYTNFCPYSDHSPFCQMTLQRTDKEELQQFHIHQSILPSTHVLNHRNNNTTTTAK